MKRYLLIIPCSKSKDHDPRALKSIDRYIGPNYKILKRLFREKKFCKLLDLVIISAKYGLLTPEDPIEDYDLKMNPQIARSLNESIMTKLRELFEKNEYLEVAINLGKEYLPSIEGIDEIIPSNTNKFLIEGGIGIRLGKMKIWLENLP